MMTRYEAWLNKKSLSAIDPAIYIRDIAYDATRFATTMSDKTGRDGQRVLDRHARSTSVVITIEIHEQDVARRQDVCSRVQAWAMHGGKLTTNDKRGQQLNVICDNPPVITSALKWTQTLKITFTAYEQPFWEDEYPRSVTLNGSNVTKSLYVPGIGAMTRVTADVKNVSGGVLNALTLKAGGSTFSFAGLALASGDALTVDYDENGLLRIRVGGVSKMHCRTAESDDDLLIETGKMHEMSVIAGGDVNAVFEARGLYL